VRLEQATSQSPPDVRRKSEIVIEEQTPVLIVGGSLAGLTTAAFLGQHGVRSLDVERHRGTAIHPRAALVYQRSMEILRSIGIEQTVRRRSYEQFEPDGAIMSVETLAGEELNWDIAHLNEAVRELSPTERMFVTQDALEPVLHERTRELGAELRFGIEMISCEQDTDGVTAVIRERDTGETSTVRTPYLVAADGGRSQIRDGLGVAMAGQGLLSKSVTIYFRAEVGSLMRGRNLSVILVRNPTFRGFFRIEKPYQSGFLIVHMLGDPDHPITDVWDLTEDRCVDLVHAGLGTEDVAVAIEDVHRWECRADLADSFREDRIFLVGDAAHVMPPYGGFGGNTAIQDAHNLAWKLALVLNGLAGSQCLSTYEIERRPVAELTVGQAYLRYVLRAALYLRSESLPPFVNDANVDLGYRYHSAAVIPDADDDGAVHGDPRESHGRPGTRAPHVALTRDGETISTHDLLGRSFVLLAGRAAQKLQNDARQAAARLGMTIEAHQVAGEGGLVDPHEHFCEAFGITPSAAVLVRPDGFVAWRARTPDAGSTDALGDALASVLARGATAAEAEAEAAYGSDHT
jgi:2-polyprenyl-6-methoxyphenol hydroxylase-like FAD-dependent oxidoreductase